MSDSEARFARRLGLLFLGRKDWLYLKDEYTPHDWEVERLADIIDPLGPGRDDIRAAVNTVRTLQLPDGVDPNEVFEQLRNYLPVNQPEDRTLTPEEAAELKKAK